MATPSSNKTKVWLAIAVAAVGAYEGLSLTAYPDIVGVPTICYGETKGVVLGETATKVQCDTQLSKRLIEFNRGVDSCVHVELTDSRRVAFVSLSYNIGTRAFCNSTVVKRINDGDVFGACEAIMWWNKAGGKVVKGLTNRREKEREFCLKEE